MSAPSLFKWHHFEADIILCAARWYLRYALSYRDVEELLRERGVWIDHTTVFRCVQRYAPELEKRCRPLLKATNDSYRVDETYIKIKKRWYYMTSPWTKCINPLNQNARGGASRLSRQQQAQETADLCTLNTRNSYYLYRAVDSTGATLDFMLSATRDAAAAERFFRMVLQASHTCTLRVITVDKHAAYPLTFDALQHDGTLPASCQLRPCKYLNNVVEQDHRFVKRQVNLGLGFGGFHTAQRPIQGYEAMHRLRKGQLEGVAKRDVLAQNRVINQLFGLAA